MEQKKIAKVYVEVNVERILMVGSLQVRTSTLKEIVHGSRSEPVRDVKRILNLLRNALMHVVDKELTIHYGLVLFSAMEQPKIVHGLERRALSDVRGPVQEHLASPYAVLGRARLACGLAATSTQSEMSRPSSTWVSR